VKLNRAHGRRRHGQRRHHSGRPGGSRFHLFCVTTAAASVPEDERVAGCKAWNCMQRRALTSSSESRGLQHRRRIALRLRVDHQHRGRAIRGNDRADPQWTVL